MNTNNDLNNDDDKLNTYNSEDFFITHNITKLKIINGDLLKATEQYIVHQCNCITTTSAGIANYINKKYPWADVYTKRKKPDIPGTIKICSSPLGNKHVICMFSQYFPGKAKNKLTEKDNIADRSKWFTSCLDKIAKQLPDVKTFAFPYKIGCGLAGGNWALYMNYLENFANFYNRDVILYNCEKQ